MLDDEVAQPLEEIKNRPVAVARFEVAVVVVERPLVNLGPQPTASRCVVLRDLGHLIPQPQLAAVVASGGRRTTPAEPGSEHSLEIGRVREARRIQTLQHIIHGRPHHLLAPEKYATLPANDLSPLGGHC